jgi:4-hydroxybenzoyl-CoA reductase subunit beta
MSLGSFEHLQPKTLNEACAALKEHGSRARVIAGGTDLLVRIKQRVATPRYLVDIKILDGMTGIRRNSEGLRLGAVTTLTDVRRSPAVQERLPVLAEAAIGVGAAQLQNMGTIGGNLCQETRCWYYQQGTSWRRSRSPCFKIGGDVCYMAKGGKRCYALYSGDMAAALLVLRAQVRLASAAGERTVGLDEFYVDGGKSHTVLRPDELLTEVLVPDPPEGQRGTYLKYRRRGTVDFPIVGVAAVLREEAGICRDLRVAVTGAGSIPFVVQGAYELVAGQELTAARIDAIAQAAWRQARPVSNMEVAVPYRRRLVQVLVGDALVKLASLS